MYYNKGLIDKDYCKSMSLKIEKKIMFILDFLIYFWYIFYEMVVNWIC